MVAHLNGTNGGGGAGGGGGGGRKGAPPLKSVKIANGTAEPSKIKRSAVIAGRLTHELDDCEARGTASLT
eukprot:2499776-Rhodomonas_salina.1